MSFGQMMWRDGAEKFFVVSCHILVICMVFDEEMVAGIKSRVLEWAKQNAELFVSMECVEEILNDERYDWITTFPNLGYCLREEIRNEIAKTCGKSIFGGSNFMMPVITWETIAGAMHYGVSWLFNYYYERQIYPCGVVLADLGEAVIFADCIRCLEGDR